MSSFREAQFYVSRKTYRRIWWISKAKGMVADALADELLTEALETKYPQLIPAEKGLESAKNQFLKDLAATGMEINDGATLD